MDGIDGGLKNMYSQDVFGVKVMGSTKYVFGNKGLGINEKKCPYGRVIVVTALYGAKTCGM